MRITALAAAVSLTLLGLSQAGGATAAIKMPTEIPPEPLSRALQSLAKERNLVLAYHSEVVGNARTAGAYGDLTLDDTLTKLLQGTGLTYRFLDDSTITIVSLSAPTDGAGIQRLPSGPGSTVPMAPPAKEEGKNSSSSTFRVAQVDREIPTVATPLKPATQLTNQSAERLEEIVVTAQKYQQRALDVPISMVVISGPELQHLGVTGVDELQYVVPGLSVQDYGTSRIIQLRGVSNGFGNGALVGSYFDDADVTLNGIYAVPLNTYDLQRVEVLRGPQGTLYGEGSLGGTVRYIANKPMLDAPHMNAYVAASFDEYGSPEEHVEAVLNTPIVRNELGLRLAADVDHEGGWIDQPAAALKNINMKDTTDVRIKGRWKPGNDLTIDATEIIDRASYGTLVGEDSSSHFSQSFGLTTTPQSHENDNISNLTMVWTPSVARVVNSATYLTYYENTNNFGGHVLQLTPPPSQPYQTYEPSSGRQIELPSDELRVTDAGGRAWHWTIGAFYRRLTVDSLPYELYFGLSGPPLPAPPFQEPADTAESTSWAGFADTSYRLFDKLTIGAGVRYYEDKEADDTNLLYARFHSVDPRFYVRYALSNDMNVYASAAKGFRSGGFNTVGEPPFEPESVWTYELGAKSSAFNHHLSADGDVFLSDYGNYQILGVPPSGLLSGSDLIENAGTARIKGVEGDLSWSPVESWLLTVGGDYLNARFVAIGVLYSSYQVGDPVDEMPRYQVNGSLEKYFKWFGRDGFARFDYSQRAPETERNRSIGPWFYGASDHLYLLGFGAGVQLSRAVQFGFFVRNLLNDRGYTQGSLIEGSSLRTQPRTFGVDFHVRGD